MATEYVLIPKQRYNQLQKIGESELGPMDHPTPTTPLPPSTTHTRGTRDVLPRTQYARRSTLLPPKGSGGGDDDADTDDAVDDDTDDTDGDNDYDVADILQSFTSSELPYIRPILKLMEDQPLVLDWNKQTGEIVFQGEDVTHSNIVELLKDTLTAKLHPTGKMEFYRGLDIMGVKLSTVKHPKNKALLAVIKGDRDVKLKQSKRKVKRLRHAKSESNPVESNKKVWLNWK